MDRKQAVTKTFLGLFCSVLLLCVGCDEFRPDMFDKKEAKPEIGPVDGSVVTANTKFGFSLFNEIRKTEQDKNIFISPIQYFCCLGNDPERRSRRNRAGDDQYVATAWIRL